MKWIRQEDPNGCVVASMAMVLGITYKQARKLGEPAFGRDRLTTYSMEEILSNFGWATMRRWRCNPVTNKFREAWPLAPFAPIHICSIQMSNGHHSVVMDKDGRIYDPADESRKDLLNPAFKRVNEMCGFWKVTTI